MVPRGGLEPPTHGFSVQSGDIIEAFLDDRKSRGLSVQTIQFYRDYLERLQNSLVSPLLVTTKEQVRGFLNSLTCTPGGKHAYLRAARTFFNWAVEEQYMTISPCKNLSVKVPNADRYTLSVEQLTQLVAACKTDIQRLTVTLLADTGIRRSELASIRVDDMDMTRRTLRIFGKGKKRRVVRFGEVTAAHLDAWTKDRTVNGKLLGIGASGISSLLVTLGKRTGIRCNPHSFRRLFACEAIRNGMNLFHVQSLLGHSTLEMTRLYAHEVGSEDALVQYVPTIR
jgi:site-specific recombinase XerD